MALIPEDTLLQIRLDWLGGINPFVYAESNPINYIDPDGLNALLLNPAIGSGLGVGAAGAEILKSFKLTRKIGAH